MREIPLVISLLFATQCYEPMDSSALGCHPVDPTCDSDDDGVLNGEDDFPEDPRCSTRNEENCTACGDACSNSERCGDEGCVVPCAGRDCGEDGFGGSCGSCDAGSLCDVNGKCVVPCATRECGDDGFGGSCGSCQADARCNEQGRCFDPCAGKECGDDGFDGSCGTCQTGYRCDSEGKCFDPCAGMSCGDDGFGGSCGSCPTGLNCDNSGKCVDCIDKYCGDDGFGGSCGTCQAGLRCSAQGTCFDPCAGRECGDDNYGGSCGTCGTSGTYLCQDYLCRVDERVWVDSATDLVWQNSSLDKVIDSWLPTIAIFYCGENAAALPGSGWRLPTIDELRSLIRGCVFTTTGGTCGVTDSCLSYYSTCDNGCDSCESEKGPSEGCYWDEDLKGDCSWYASSSLLEDYSSPTPAWVVNFADGSVTYCGREGICYDSNVRCVRNGP